MDKRQPEMQTASDPVFGKVLQSPYIAWRHCLGTSWGSAPSPPRKECRCTRPRLLSSSWGWRHTGMEGEWEESWLDVPVVKDARQSHPTSGKQ